MKLSIIIAIFDIVIVIFLGCIVFYVFFTILVFVF